MGLFSVNIIGAGNLGKTMGRLISIHRIGTIIGVCNTSLNSSIDAIRFIGQGKPYKKIEDLPPVDITLIATPDDLIKKCCEKLSNSSYLKVNSLIFHCSGSLSSDILNSAKVKRCLVASAHPMRSFAAPKSSVEQYSGTFCAIEGDNKAISILRDIFNGIGSVTYKIDSTKKGEYHAAGVFASNYLVTLCNESLLCLKNAGVDDTIAIKMVLSLMSGTLKNLETSLSPKDSLTGPIKRGDINTIQKHLDSISEPLTALLYKSLGLATLDVANLNIEKDENIRVLLSDKPSFSIKAKL